MKHADALVDVVEETIQETAEDLLAEDALSDLPDDVQIGFHLGVTAMLVRAGVVEPGDAIRGLSEG